MKDNVLVIIVTFNGSKWIENCLKSLYGFSNNFHVLVIDNFSNDDTVEIIKREFKEVEVVMLDENLGFGKANNLALRIGILKMYDYFFLLNQDTIVSADLVSRLLNCYKENKLFGILSPIHFDGSGKNLDINFEYFLLRQRNSRLFSEVFCSDDFFEGKIFHVGFINAAAWFFSREVLMKVGFFNPLFPHYGEDSDFYNRLIFNNGGTYIFTGASIKHFSTHSYEIPEFDFRKSFNREKVEVWVRALNINKRYSSAIFSVTLSELKLIFIYLLRLDFRRLFVRVFCLSSVYINFLKFWKLRHDSKKTGAFIN